MTRDENGKRKTKKTKAKRNGELHGKFTAKAIRKYEANSNVKPTPKPTTKKCY